MQIKMNVDVSGMRDGERWPQRGEVVDVPDAEAADLIAAKIASPVENADPVRGARRKGEKATVEPDGEKR